jgi:hypothetical protein
MRRSSSKALSFSKIDSRDCLTLNPDPLQILESRPGRNDTRLLHLTVEVRNLRVGSEVEGHECKISDFLVCDVPNVSSKIEISPYWISSPCSRCLLPRRRELQKEYSADSASVKAFLKSAEKSALPIAVSTSRNMPTTVSDCSSHSSPATGAVDTGAGDTAGNLIDHD